MTACAHVGARWRWTTIVLMPVKWSALSVRPGLQVVPRVVALLTVAVSAQDIALLHLREDNRDRAPFPHHRAHQIVLRAAIAMVEIQARRMGLAAPHARRALFDALKPHPAAAPDRCAMGAPLFEVLVHVALVGVAPRLFLPLREIRIACIPCHSPYDIILRAFPNHLLERKRRLSEKLCRAE